MKPHVLTPHGAMGYQPPGKTGSLADRMAAFSGSGGGGGGGQKEKEKEDGSSKQGAGGAEPVVTAKPSAEPPATQVS